MSSSFGTIYRVTTFGESHCKGVGAIVDGCPSQITLSEADIQPQLDRRRPGQSRVSTKRNEADQVSILSGIEHGVTLGTPIGLFVANKDQRPGDYGEMAQIPRPSHADYTYLCKYGIKASSGGGRSSARETIGRVAAGTIAEKVLKQWHNVSIIAWVSAVSDIEAEYDVANVLTREEVDANIIRCPDAHAAEQMIAAIDQAREEGDSLGGVVTCVCRNVPVGLGEPVFDKLEATLAQAMMSIPATKGFEVGAGFAGTRLKGSQSNDCFTKGPDGLRTLTNNSGGIQGGITNGEDIVMRIAFKPPATISMAQKTVDMDGNEVVLEAKGRHDPCVVARAVPIVESMAAMTLLDAVLIQKTRS